jgi:hypothetical protein
MLGMQWDDRFFDADRFFSDMRQRQDRSACTGTFASGTPCPAAGECDRYARGLVATSTRQVWSRFEADESGARCEQFAAIELG